MLKFLGYREVFLLAVVVFLCASLSSFGLDRKMKSDPDRTL